jgi:hypothetical protein
MLGRGAEFSAGPGDFQPGSSGVTFWMTSWMTGAGADRGVVENSKRQALKSSAIIRIKAITAGIFIFGHLGVDRNRCGILAQSYLTGKTFPGFNKGPAVVISCESITTAGLWCYDY